mgnify:CR=1 FL=1
MIIVFETRMGRILASLRIYVTNILKVDVMIIVMVGGVLMSVTGTLIIVAIMHMILAMIAIVAMMLMMIVAMMLMIVVMMLRKGGRMLMRVAMRRRIDSESGSIEAKTRISVGLVPMNANMILNEAAMPCMRFGNILTS